MFPVAFPGFPCSVLVDFPSWLALFVVPVCGLARFTARRSAGACSCMHTHFHVRSLLMSSRAWRVLFLVCFCVPSLPHFPVFSFFLFCFSTDFFFQCDGCSGVFGVGGGGGEGLVAGVQVGKATGVVYFPGLGFMCSLAGGGVGHWAPNLHLQLTLLMTS